MEKRRVIEYEDERNDEFSTAVITPKRIDGSWVYLHRSAWKRFTRFFWYRIIALPVGFCWAKIAFHQKTVGRALFKPYRKSGFFLYGNHTQPVGDAVFPTLIDFPKSNYAIVHPNNVSMPVLGRITPSLGALPLPDDLRAHRNFTEAIRVLIEEKNAVVISPEAHIWPYYTRIRPFPETSFFYPVRLNAPAFCFTNTYQKRRFGKKPKIVTYVDGPFFANGDRPERERAKDLADRIRAAMTERAKLSSVEVIRYIRKGGNNG